MARRTSVESRAATMFVLATTTWVLAACIVALVVAPERATALHLQSWSRATLIAGATALALLAVGLVLKELRRSRLVRLDSDLEPRADLPSPEPSEVFEHDWTEDVAEPLGRVAAAMIPSLADWCLIELLVPGAPEHHVALRHGSERASSTTGVGDLEGRFDAAFPGAEALRAQVRATGATLQWPAEVDATPPRCVIVGIGSDGEPMGTITIANDAPRRGFDARDVAVVVETARRCGESLERVALQQRARDAVRRSQRLASQLHQLIAASITIAGIQSEAGVVEALARRARSVFDAETAVVTLREGPGAPLVATALRGHDTLVGHLVDSTDAPHVSADSLGDGAALRIDGWLVLPILVELGAARGVVSVRRRDEVGFSDDDVEIATLLAQMATSALGATELNLSILSSEERLRVLVETAPIGIVESNADGEIRWWNQKAGTLFGWTDDERARGSATFPGGAITVLRELWGAAAAGAPVASREAPGVEIHDTKRDLAVSVARLPSLPGAGDNFLTLVDDVTDHRQLMEELRHAQRMEVIGQLSSSVAHDFNNLLTLIAGYAELLIVEVAVSDRARQLITDIQATTARASTLTGKLLTMGRTKTPAPVVFAPVEAVRGIAEVLDRIIGADIELVLELDRSSANVRADPDQFEQIIMNLATNARDAMESGGTLRISIAPAQVGGHEAQGAGLPSGEYVRIEVSDTGSGMDDETQQKCFEPLFTTKGPSRGTGLGLPAARRVVTESGGSIACRSVLGNGTTFEIHLPAVLESAPLSVEPERDDEVLETATVLLAEDEDGIRSLISRVLSHRGFEVLEAENGERALEIARAHSGTIELLVSDVVMPGMSGRELALQLQSDRPELLIVLASGNLDASVLEGLADSSAVFLAKPFKPSELVSVIAELRALRGTSSPHQV